MSEESAEARGHHRAHLPPWQRGLILRRYEAGGSVQKLASELDRPASSVSVTLHRIRKLLSDCIARNSAEGGTV